MSPQSGHSMGYYSKTPSVLDCFDCWAPVISHERDSGNYLKGEQNGTCYLNNLKQIAAPQHNANTSKVCPDNGE